MDDLRRADPATGGTGGTYGSRGSTAAVEAEPTTLAAATAAIITTRWSVAGVYSPPASLWTSSNSGGATTGYPMSYPEPSYGETSYPAPSYGTTTGVDVPYQRTPPEDNHGYDNHGHDNHGHDDQNGDGIGVTFDGHSLGSRGPAAATGDSRGDSRLFEPEPLDRTALDREIFGPGTYPPESASPWSPSPPQGTPVRGWADSTGGYPVEPSSGGPFPVDPPRLLPPDIVSDTFHPEPVSGTSPGTTSVGPTLFSAPPYVNPFATPVSAPPTFDGFREPTVPPSTPDSHTPDGYGADGYTPNGYAPVSGGAPSRVMDSGLEDLSVTGSVLADLPFPEPAPLPPEDFDLPPFLSAARGESDGAESPNGVAAGDSRRSSTEHGLPQRVPSVPDVPDLPEVEDEALVDPLSAPMADGQNLSRIATYLKDNNEPADSRPDGFDLAAVVDAVRSVSDVDDVRLHWTAGQGHTLRIDLRDGAHAGEVTRRVARLLRETLGIAAEPNLGGTAWFGTDESTLDHPMRTRGRATASVVGTAAVPGRYAPPEQRQPTASGSVAPSGSGAQHHGRPLRPPASQDGRASVPRVVIEHVRVTTVGLDATVEVRLTRPGGLEAIGTGRGPAVDAYLLRLAATAAGEAVDQFLTDHTGTPRGRCFVEHAAIVPFAGCDVAVVVLLLVHSGLSEQLSGSAVVAGDPRQAVVRATLSAVNRRLESLLS